MTRPHRQEQEPAGEAVTEVAPGVRRVQLPIALPGLGHVNCYVLEDRRGVAVVDPGLPGPAAWKALRAGLERADVPLRRVHTVVVTHSHPDHFGGAGRLRRETGAEIVTHRSFRTFWDPDETGEDESPELPANPDRELAARARAGRSPWQRETPWGGQRHRPPLRQRVVFGLMRGSLRRWFPGPTPTRRVDDAEVVHLAGREWVSLHTPGHTPDHLCLFDPAEGVLLSGDHVLPTITPHIGGLGLDADPLAAFFASLERIGELDGVTTVLPAHGHPFDDARQRVKAIRRHHEERLDALRRATADLGPATVEDLSHEVFSPRAWGSMAESETYAHLEHLRLLGEAERLDGEGGVLRYALR
ncbi:MAG: MBL fold metallo-hydrolase [Acidimicrobiales bacterium]|nr:MBL fold metallo-hydrolase [Acidimicrobiales bacterium]